MTRDQIVKAIVEEVGEEEADDILLADGFEDAFVGIVKQFTGNLLACYSYEVCVLLLMRRDGMSIEEAREFMDVNVTGAWVGERTPAFLFSVTSPIDETDDTQDVKIGGDDGQDSSLS